MLDIDPLILDLNDLPDVNNLPTSEEEIRELFEHVNKKAAAAQEHSRKLRRAKFLKAKNAKAKRPADVQASAGGSEQGTKAELEDHLRKLEERLKVAETCTADVQESVISYVRAAIEAWPEVERSKVDEMLKALKVSDPTAQAAVEAAAEVAAEADESSTDAEDLQEEAAVRELQLKVEATALELQRLKERVAQGDNFVGDGESTSASRGTSVEARNQKDHPSVPSSARSDRFDDAASQLNTASTLPPPEPQANEQPQAPPKGKGKGPAPPKGKGKGPGAPPAAAGKGKATGKGPGGPPPPPPSSSGSKGEGKGASKGSGKATSEVPRSNGLSNLFWQVTKEDDVSNYGKEFLTRLIAAKIDDGFDENESADLKPLQLDKSPVTIFTPVQETAEVPKALLEHFYSKRRETSSNSFRSGVDGGQDANGQRRRERMLDSKCIHMLGITLRKHMQQNKGLNITEAILNIKEAVLRCDFQLVSFAALGVIRTALRQHEEAEPIKRPVCELVKTQGLAALDGLESPDEHRLVYELSKVPQIDERLECMLFHVMFQDSLREYRRSIDSLHKVLEMLNDKRETIQRFFMTALRLGQSLNREGNAPKAPNGFQLASLEKLSQTKSTKLPRMSILHFILALMSREDAHALFNEADLGLLNEAKALKTHKVFTDCVELAQGLYGVQLICETGKYIREDTRVAVTMERRRKSVCPSRALAANAELADDDDLDLNDRFHEVMKDFVDANLEAAEDLGERAFSLILLYKELAIYFDDMRSVYPPPKSESDSRKDLVDIFAKFARDIQKHRQEVDNEGLRGKLTSLEGNLSETNLPGKVSASEDMQGSQSFWDTPSSSSGSPQDGGQQGSCSDQSTAGRRSSSGDRFCLGGGDCHFQNFELQTTPKDKGEVEATEVSPFRSGLVDRSVRDMLSQMDSEGQNEAWLRPYTSDE